MYGRHPDETPDEDMANYAEETGNTSQSRGLLSWGIQD